MADETLTQLYTGAAWPNGFSVSNLMLLMDVTDLSMASTGTDKGITVADWLNQYFHAGSNITLASGPTGLTITSTAVAGVSSVFSRTGAILAVAGDYTVGQVTGAAPLASPTFTGIPAGPTATAGTSTTQLATTAFVATAVAGVTIPVTSVFGRTGVIAAAGGDYTVGQVTGAAPLASPTFTGAPAAPTATAGTNTTQLATTQFVSAAVAASPVISVFGRLGAISAASGDYTVGQITGAASINSPTFIGTPSGPTATPGTSTIQLATTAFVAAAVIAGVPVTSVFGRTGAIVPTGGDYTVGQIGGAVPLASPALTGTPTAPTATGGTSTTQIATTAFVAAAIPSVPVTAVFGRTGAIVATSGDYTVAQVAGAAPLASPTFTGVPAAPTATLGTNTTQLATTAFVNAAIGGSGSVLSVFGRTGTVISTSGDYAVGQITGAAPLASPALTGAPTAPTATAGTNTTQIATTAFVTAAIGGGGVVVSIFGRTGAVVAAGGDYAVAQVTGAAPLASPAFTGIPTAPTATFGTNTTQLATTAFVEGAVAAGTGAITSVFGRVGVIVSASGDYAVAQVTGAAPLASPTFSGVPSGPTATAGTSTTQLATTAFVGAAVAAGGAVTSVFGRSGVVVASTGDYTVAQVTGAAPLASPTFTGTVTLPAGTVTLAQQANFAASRLMGNPTGAAAAPSAISLGTNLSFAGSVLNATGGGMTNPMTTLGDVIYEDGTPTAVRLAGNTTSTNKFLTQTGTGVVSAAPAWNAIAVGDVPALPASKITSGAIATTQGGTNLGSLTANAVMLGSGTAAVQFATTGVAGRILIDLGAGTNPAFTGMSQDVVLNAAGQATIQPGVVTLAKMANLSNGTLMGNPTGSPAAPSQITLGANLTFSGSTLVATGGSPGGTAGQIQTNNGSGGFGALPQPLPVGSGGTGLGTLTANAVVLGNLTSTPGFATVGTAGRVLTDNGWHQWLRRIPRRRRQVVPQAYQRHRGQGLDQPVLVAATSLITCRYRRSHDHIQSGHVELAQGDTGRQSKSGCVRRHQRPRIHDRVGSRRCRQSRGVLVRWNYLAYGALFPSSWDRCWPH